ncbi:unnamed protein product [Alternaria alternata]
MLATIPIAFAEGTVVAPHGATYDVYVGLKPINDDPDGVWYVINVQLFITAGFQATKRA